MNLNLGCGTIILPGEKPSHHGLLPDDLYSLSDWVNVDRNAAPGVDVVCNLWRLPLPFADNTFDNVLAAHILEHVPHAILPDVFGERAPVNVVIAADDCYLNFQDGWYAFMYELWRVLKPDGRLHALTPYGWSNSGVTDPSHTRYLTEHVWVHSLQPDADTAPFHYSTGGLHFEQDNDVHFKVTGLHAHTYDSQELLARALQTDLNVVHEMYVRLRAVKHARAD